METTSIHFSAPIDRSFHSAAGKLRWELGAVATKRNLYTWLIVIGLFLLLAILRQDDKGFLQICSSLGIAFGILFLLSWYDFRTRKDTYFKAIETELDRLLAQGNEVAYTFTDEQMQYRDAEKYFEVKWTALKAYSLYKDHLLIWQNDSPFMAHVFKAGEEGLDEASYSQLVDLVKVHLPYKELKKR